MTLSKSCYTKTGALRADVRQALFDLACVGFAAHAGRLRIHAWARSRAGYYDRHGRLVALPTYKALSVLAARGVEGAAAVLSMPVKNDSPRGGAAGDYIDVPSRFKGRKELINAYESVGFMVDPGH